LLFCPPIQWASVKCPPDIGLHQNDHETVASTVTMLKSDFFIYLIIFKCFWTLTDEISPASLLLLFEIRFGCFRVSLPHHICSYASPSHHGDGRRQGHRHMPPPVRALPQRTLISCINVSNPVFYCCGELFSECCWEGFFLRWELFHCFHKTYAKD
jgi:hypothetical protein